MSVTDQLWWTQAALGGCIAVTIVLFAAVGLLADLVLSRDRRNDRTLQLLWDRLDAQASEIIYLRDSLKSWHRAHNEDYAKLKRELDTLGEVAQDLYVGLGEIEGEAD